MKKIAIIDRVTPDSIYATYNQNDSGGHSRAFIKIQEDLSFKVDNVRNLFLKKGDTVEIFIEPRGAIALTFAMFIMPLIIFVAFYLLAGLIIKGDSEIFKILTGLAGIVISFLSTYLYFKIKPQKLPTVTRKLSSSEIKEVCAIGSSCQSGSCATCSGH